MKRYYVLFALFIAILSTESMAQFREKPPPAIYFSYQPADHGLGIRGDYHINYLSGVYGSASYGTWGLYKKAGMQNHVKLTAGVLIPYKDWMGNQHDFSIGFNYHYVEERDMEVMPFWVNDDVYKHYSFEIGLTVKYPRFTLGIRTDILRWEPCVDIGIPIGKRSNIIKK